MQVNHLPLHLQEDKGIFMDCTGMGVPMRTRDGMGEVAVAFHRRKICLPKASTFVKPKAATIVKPAAASKKQAPKRAPDAALTDMVLEAVSFYALRKPFEGVLNRTELSVLLIFTCVLHVDSNFWILHWVVWCFMDSFAQNLYLPLSIHLLFELVHNAYVIVCFTLLDVLC